MVAQDGIGPGILMRVRKAALFNWLAYRAAGRSRPRARNPRWKVGIYKVDRLGDFVLSLGAIRAVTEIAGQENCVLFHGAAAAQMARREFPSMARFEMPPLDGRLWLTRRRLRAAAANPYFAGGVGQLLCLRHFRTLSDEVALQAIPATAVRCVRNSPVVAVDYELVSRRFEGDITEDRPTRGIPGEFCEDLACHEGLLRGWAGAALGARDLRPRLGSIPDLPRRILSVTPFGSDRIRDIPAAHVAAVASHARIALGLDCELLTPEDARPRYEALLQLLAERGVPARLRVTRTVDEFVDALATSGAVLTTETSTAHIAAALDRPLVCLLGGGHFGMFAPWSRSDRQAWISKDLPCYHCNWNCVHPEPYCITGVQSGQLIDALQRVMAATPSVPVQASA